MNLPKRLFFRGAGKGAIKAILSRTAPVAAARDISLLIKTRPGGRKAKMSARGRAFAARATNVSQKNFIFSSKSVKKRIQTLDFDACFYYT